MKYFKKFCECCCFVCVKCIFDFFNSGAYPMIHLTGDSYCTSGFAAMALRIAQPVSTAVVAFLEKVFKI